MASTTAFAGSIPKLYDEGMGPIIFQPYAEDLAARVDVNAKDVLEIAAGTGRLTKELCKRLGPNARLTVTDLNKDMLRIAREQIDDPRITWEVADAQQLEHPSSAYDVVVCQYGVMFYKDKVCGHREAFRVLRPGGAYLFSAWDSIDENPWSKIIHETMADLFPENQPGFFAVPYSYFQASQIESDLKEAGFEHIVVEHVRKDVIAENAIQLARGGVEGSPLAAALRERGITDLAPIVEEVRARYEKNFGNSPMRSIMQALVVTASKAGE
jgi:ubiquinone/menaquinone biosynthesis C-methylase UbiE